MVFHDRCLGPLMGANAGGITEVEVGDTLFVAWIEDDSFRTGPFEVTEILHSADPEFKVSKGSREGCISGGIPLFILVDVDDLEKWFEPGYPEHAVLGISTSSDGLVLEMIITLTLIGYSLSEAVDYTVTKLGVSNTIWSHLRGEDQDEIEERIDLVQEGLNEIPGVQ